MRVQIAGPVKVKQGQTVRFYTRLGKAPIAFCEIYSAVDGFDPSPHTEHFKLSLASKNGQPAMTNALTMRLSDMRPAAETAVTADEDCIFFIMQDVDTDADKRAKARIEIDGKPTTYIAQACRWILRNARRRRGRGHARKNG